MTASKMWALIFSLIVVGVGIVGAAIYRQGHPDAEIAKLVAPPSLNPPSPSATKPSTLPGGPDTATNPADKAPEPATVSPEPTKSAPPKAAAAEPAAGRGEPPHFDIVRVEPKGDAVIAGKGDPNAKVALVEQGKVVAEAKADASGHFVILPPPLKPGDHDLTLRQSTDGKAGPESQQNVAVSVPQKSNGEVVVALAEPGKPTKVLSAPAAPPSPATAAAPPPPAPPEAATPSEPKMAVAKPETAVTPPAAIAPKGPDLAIRTAELENGNGFYATGVAAAGTRVEVYLNGSHIAEVQAAPDGQWSVTIKKGLKGGHYIVRADAIDTDRKVTARVEVPFDVPVAMAEGPKPVAPSAETPASEPPSAPNPSDLGLVPSPSVSAKTEPELPSIVPTPRPDIAAAAKAAGEAAPGKAPPVLAVSPPAAAETPKAAPAPEKLAIAPAKPADAPPALTATAPSVSPPKRAEMSAATGASAPAAGSQAAPEAAAPGANAVIEQVETALVVSGDNLWNISRAKLGQGMRYTQIYAANASQIRNPRLIYPGQVFVMPQN